MTTANEYLDIVVENHGSIVLLQPLTEAGHFWLDHHLPYDAQKWGSAYAVEPRYVQDIIDGMENDGLVVDA